MSTGVAPVEFDPFSAVFFDDPYPTYQRLRDEAPVYFNARYGFYALSRYEDVCRAHKDWESAAARIDDALGRYVEFAKATAGLNLFSRWCIVAFR